MIQMNPDPPYMQPTMHTLHQPLQHSPSIAGGLGSGLSGNESQRGLRRVFVDSSRRAASRRSRAAGIKRDGRSMTSALPPQEEDAPGLYSFEMNTSGAANQQEEAGLNRRAHTQTSRCSTDRVLGLDARARY